MATSLKFRDLLLRNEVISSHAEFKRLMLTGYLALICVIVAVIYTIVDVLNDVYYALPAYGILFIMPILSLAFIRFKRYNTAKIILVISTNMVVFWAALNDPFETGAFLFFIPTGIGSFAILGFEHRRTGIVLAGLTTILFMLAYFGDLKSVEISRPTIEYIRISFILNYFISLTISVLAVFFLMNLNKLSENELIRKEIFANQKNSELQKVNEELDRFVYSVSHDLRSPLSSILGLINLARLTTDQKELNQILYMIQGRVNAQDHFIREIIDYSRNARTETASEPINLKQLVDEVINSLKFNIDAEKIEFRKRVPNELLLISDKIRLTIILSNLISNAIKYHDFTKKNPFIEVGFEPDVSALYVRDNGTGVKPEHQEKIFDMFYRGSDRSTGSGLGLFITRETVTKLHGTVQMKSIYGEGSTFFVLLPKTQFKFSQAPVVNY